MQTARSLDTYRLLGRSGLRVSPLSLGTVTFGTDWKGTGVEEVDARRIFDVFVERGGNFFDTANRYQGGQAEAMLGKFAQGRRERLILSTKYGQTVGKDDPNEGGNHRRSMVRSVEASLKRLDTDYIDLLYLHCWDSTTQVDEILRGMDDLVKSGKVVYVGISNTPAWQVSRMQTMADLRGWSPLVALQVEYSLIERTVERELLPMAREMGLGVIPWSPTGSGVLSGKYGRADLEPPTSAATDTSKRRIAALVKLNERSLAIIDVVKAVANEIERSPSQVALAWTLLNPAVISPAMGVRSEAQLEDSLGALTIDFSDDQRRRLDAVSAIELGFPHRFLASPMVRDSITGGAKIIGRAAAEDRARATVSPVAAKRPDAVAVANRARGGCDGVWDLVIKMPVANLKSVMTVQTNGKEFTGTHDGDLGSGDLCGTIDGSKLCWTMNATVPMSMTLDCSATVDADTLTGSVVAGALGSFPLSGQRRK